MPIPSRLLQRLFSFGALQATQIILPLLALPYLARVVGPDIFGIILYMLNISTMVKITIDWGFSLGAVREVSAARTDTAELAAILRRIVGSKCILGLGCMALGIMAAPFVPYAKAFPVFYACAIIYGIVLGLNPLWFFQGRGTTMQRMVLWDIASSALALGLTIVVVRSQNQALGYFVCLIICKGLAYGTQNIQLLSAYRGGVFSISSSLKALRQVFVLFFAALSSMVYTNLSVLLLGNLLPPAQIGIFIAADKIVRAVVSLINPVTQTVFPEVCAARKDGQAQALRMLYFSFFGTLLLMLAAGGVVFIFAGPLVATALGEKYLEAVPVLRTLVFFIPLLACNMVIGSQALVAFGHDRVLTITLFITGVISLPCVWLATLLWGIKGAAWIPVFVEAVILCGFCIGIYCYCPELLPKWQRREKK